MSEVVKEVSVVEKAEKKDPLSGINAWLRMFAKSTSEPENNRMSNKDELTKEYLKQRAKDVLEEAEALA